MPTVAVSFTPLPAHVRTARLIALAVARRAGVDEQLLDEVRLAVGEACSRAVNVHQGSAADAPIVMLLSDEQDRFSVQVTDKGPLEGAAEAGDLRDLDPQALTDETAADTDPVPELLPPGFGLAVISGLVEDVSVTSDTDGTSVRMTWPATDAMAPGSR
jgi:anti-sigma regulatory factor (Ser/Thr protein kinase)